MRTPILSLAVVALVAGRLRRRLESRLERTAPPGPRSTTARRRNRGRNRPPTPYGGVTYEDPGVNPYVDPDEDQVSTFALDVDTASYTIAQRYVDDGNRPDPGQRPRRGVGQRLRPGLSRPGRRDVRDRRRRRPDAVHRPKTRSCCASASRPATSAIAPAMTPR